MLCLIGLRCSGGETVYTVKEGFLSICTMGKRDTFFCIGVRHHKTSLHPLMASFLYSYDTARCHSKL